MKPADLLTLLLFGLLGCGVLFLLSHRADPVAIPLPKKSDPAKWQAASYEEALALAKASGRSAVVVFSASWCVPCKKLHKELNSPRVQNVLAGGYVFAGVDGDARKDLTKRLGVNSYPTLILLSSEGKELRRTSGYKTADEFLAWLGPRED